MRIVYCIPALYNAAGMERVLTQKVNWLAAHTDYELTILTTERTPAGQKDTYFELDRRVQVVALNIDFDADYRKPLWQKWCGHMRRMRAYERALRAYVIDNKVDLCISLCGKEIAFLRHLPCRTIAEVHFAMDQRRQLLMANHKGAIWSLLGRIRTWQLVQAVRPLERLVVLTERDKTQWQQAGCTNVVCIPNPCSINHQFEIINHKSPILLAVGRLHEQKGFDLLLQAWQPIEQAHPEWTLRIVGEGDKHAALEAQIRGLGLQHAVLAGQTADVVKEYRQASLFVLSSRYEGLPLALIEAMWCGLPCVAFDCPHGPAELLAEDRGWLVPNGDIAVLQQQLEYAMTHSEEAVQRALKAQAYVQKTYSEERIMPQWLQIINRQIVNRQIVN